MFNNLSMNILTVVWMTGFQSFKEWDPLTVNNFLRFLMSDMHICTSSMMLSTDAEIYTVFLKD